MSRAESEKGTEGRSQKVIRWDEFPALREVLESARPSDKYYGLMSTTDTMFAQIERFMVIAATAEEHRKELLEAVRESPEGAAPLEADLDRLSEILQSVTHHIVSETNHLLQEMDSLRVAIHQL